MTQEIKTNLTSLGFAIGCLLLYFFFPIGGLKFEIIIGVLSFFLLLPVLYTKIVLKRSVNVMGFTSFNIRIADIFYIISAIVIGGCLSFGLISLGWGLDNYVSTISDVVLYNFGAFALYELVFVSTALFLITFFAWGFVYSIKWHNPIYSFVTAFIVYVVLMVDFYNTFWFVIPFLVPAFFVQKIRDGKNIVYMFSAVFLIGLIVDTLIIKIFS